MGNNPSKPDFAKLSDKRSDAFWETEKSKPAGESRPKPAGVPKWLKGALNDKKHFAHDEMTLMRSAQFEDCQEAMRAWNIPEYFWDQIQVGGFTADDCAKPDHQEDDYWQTRDGNKWDKIINLMPWSTFGGKMSLMHVAYNFRGARRFREILKLKGKLSPAQKAYTATLHTGLLKFGIENDFSRRLKQFVRSQHNPKPEVSIPGRRLWYTEPDGTVYGGLPLMNGGFGYKWNWKSKLACDAAWRYMRVLKVGEEVVQMREDEYAARQAEKNNPKKLTFEEKVEAGKIVIVQQD